MLLEHIEPNDQWVVVVPDMINSAISMNMMDSENISYSLNTKLWTDK